MPRSSNILKFPGSPLHGWNLKLFAVLFYVFIALMLTRVLDPTEGAIGFLILLGFLYQFLLRQQSASRHYLQQNVFLLIILFLLAMFVFQKTLIPIIAIAIIYWVLVGRITSEPPYFIRFHLLTPLVINTLILIIFLLLFSAARFVNQLLLLFNLQLNFLFTLQSYGLLVLWGVIWSVAIWLSLTAIFGRTPYIGFVTNNIRHWI